MGEKLKKIKAMKAGGVKMFSQRTWDIAHPETQGWTKVGEADGLAPIEAEEIITTEIEEPTTIEKEVVVQEIPIKEMVLEKPTPESTTIEKKVIEVIEIPIGETDDSLYPTDDEIKAFIIEKTGKAPHHMAKTKRLRELYDENK